MKVVLDVILGVIGIFAGIVIFTMPLWLAGLIATLADKYAKPIDVVRSTEIFVYEYPDNIIVKTEYTPEQINRSDIRLLYAPSWYKPPIDTVSCNTIENVEEHNTEHVENTIVATPLVEPIVESTVDTDDYYRKLEEERKERKRKYKEELEEELKEHRRKLKEEYEEQQRRYKEELEEQQRKYKEEFNSRKLYESLKSRLCEEYSSDTFISYEEFMEYNSMKDGPKKLREKMHNDFLKRVEERATTRKPINRDVMCNHVKHISDSSRLDICNWTQVIMANLNATPRDIADELGVNLMSVSRFTSGEGRYVNIKLLAWFLNNDGYSDTHIIQERFAYENYDKKIRPIPSRSEYSLVLNTVYNSYIKAKNSDDQNVKLVLYMEYTKLQENDTVKQIEMSIIKPMLYYRYKNSKKTS